MNPRRVWLELVCRVRGHSFRNLEGHYLCTRCWLEGELIWDLPYDWTMEDDDEY